MALAPEAAPSTSEAKARAPTRRPARLVGVSIKPEVAPPLQLCRPRRNHPLLWPPLLQLLLLLLCVRLCLALQGGQLAVDVGSPDERVAQVAAAGESEDDYEDEFYIYAPLESAPAEPARRATARTAAGGLHAIELQTETSHLGANKSSLGVNVEQKQQQQRAQIGTNAAADPKLASKWADASESTQKAPAKALGAGQLALAGQATPYGQRRPSSLGSGADLCVGHRDSEWSFVWTCRGLQVFRVPPNLEPRPTSLRLTGMSIEALTNEQLQPYRDTIRDFSIENAPRLTSIERNAFANLTRLRVVYIFQAPRLIAFDFAIMGAHPELTIIRVQQSGLSKWPDLSLFEQTKVLSSVDLDNNRIETLGERPLNISTELLNLEFNRIQTIGEHTFNGSQIATLSLHGNKALVSLHRNAFAHLRNLIKLDLSGTSVAQLPTSGWANLRFLAIRDNFALKQIPSIYAFPQLEEAELTYAYHCCSFRYPQRHNPEAYEQHKRVQEELNAYCASKALSGAASGRSPGNWAETGTEASNSLAVAPVEPGGGRGEPARGDPSGESFENWGQFDEATTVTISSLLRQTNSTNQRSSQYASVRANKSAGGQQQQVLAAGQGERLQTSQIDCGELVQKDYGPPNISCTPEPDAFNPCEDIMGYPVLRVAVWFVVGASLFGNLSVIVVHTGICRRLSVPKFLQLNLAIGDLFMGVYLATLASADLATKGTYFNYAIDWQHGLGCSLVGAVSLFASQLSIFTLSVITFERYYTITNSIDLNMRLKLGWAWRIMAMGWLFALTVALLPAWANVSSYSKTSICLPMRTIYAYDRAFIVSLLVVDLLAFLIIFVCYLKMYLLIRDQKSEATQKERTVARRMALLVFTDFACWAPIIFFAATAVLGQPLISVTNSKILIVFFYPLNSMANPFLYVLTTRQYRRDLDYVACKWRAWRQGLFKRQADQLTFANYNNHHPANQPHGLGQFPSGAQLNAHLGAVAAVTGVAHHLRHYRLPIEQSGVGRRRHHCADLELVKWASISRGSTSEQSGRKQSGGPNLKANSNPLASSGQCKQVATTGGSAHYIIRHTILADKSALGYGRSSCANNKQRVHRALRQRAVLLAQRQQQQQQQQQPPPGLASVTFAQATRARSPPIAVPADHSKLVALSRESSCNKRAANDSLLEDLAKTNELEQGDNCAPRVGRRRRHRSPGRGLTGDRAKCCCCCCHHCANRIPTRRAQMGREPGRSLRGASCRPALEAGGRSLDQLSKVASARANNSASNTEPTVTTTEQTTTSTSWTNQELDRAGGADLEPELAALAPYSAGVIPQIITSDQRCHEERENSLKRGQGVEQGAQDGAKTGGRTKCSCRLANKFSCRRKPSSNSLEVNSVHKSHRRLRRVARAKGPHEPALELGQVDNCEPANRTHRAHKRQHTKQGCPANRGSCRNSSGDLCGQDNSKCCRGAANIDKCDLLANPLDLPAQPSASNATP